MNINTSDSGTLVLIAIMMAVTVFTRWGGIFVMSYVLLTLMFVVLFRLCLAQY